MGYKLPASTMLGCSWFRSLSPSLLLKCLLSTPEWNTFLLGPGKMSQNDECGLSNSSLSGQMLAGKKKQEREGQKKMFGDMMEKPKVCLQFITFWRGTADLNEFHDDWCKQDFKLLQRVQARRSKEKKRREKPFHLKTHMLAVHQGYLQFYLVLEWHLHRLGRRRSWSLRTLKRPCL